MATYSRVKTFVANETLTASDLNTEFNNIITNTNSGNLNSDNVSTSAAWTWTGYHTYSTSSRIVLADNIYMTLGNATDGDYRLRYNSSSTALELTSTNSDGSGTDAVVMDVQDGTDDVRIRGGFSTDNNTAPTSGIVTGGNIVSDTDSTDDLGTTSVRWANLYVDAATITNNLTVGGTLTLTGGLTLNGNVTVGDSASDTLTINSTITSNLLFTDATYDIGASGATRPRDLFLSRNAVMGGTLGVTGATTLSSTLGVTGALTATAGITSGSGIVSDSDSTDDLGTTSVRWANLYVDSIGDTGQALAITAGSNNVNVTAGTLALTGAQTISSTLGVTGLITASGGVSGALTGNVTGNVAGNLTGDVTGNISGNVTGGTISGTTGTFSDDLTVGTTDLIVDVSANKVGIGAAPTEELDIQGSGATQTIRLIRTDASTAGGITINSANGSNYVYNTAAKDLVISADNGATQTKLHANGDFSVNTSQLFVDQSTSAVGVGTSSPAGLGVRSLNVKAPSSGGADLTIEADNGNNFGVFFSGATASDPFSIFSNTGFKFATASDKNATGFDEHMRITSTGVGINCTPKDTLHVKVGTNLNWQFGYPNNSVTTLAALNDAESAYVTARIDAGTLELNGQSGGDVNLGAGVLVVDTSADRVGINTASPSALIHVSQGGSYPTMTANTHAIVGNTSSGSAISRAAIMAGATTGFSVLDFGDTDASNAGGITYSHQYDRLNLCAGAGATRASIDSDGLKFGSDTAAANALDDYEEGTFTVTLGGSTTNPTVTYAVQTGRYTKIGNLVTINVRLGTSAITGGAGDILIHGLPYTQKNEAASRLSTGAAVYNLNVDASCIGVSIEGVSNATYLYLLESKDSTTWSTVDWTQVASSSFYVQFTTQYYV